MTDRANLSPLHLWWLSKLESGVLINGEWPEIAVKRALWRDYDQAGASPKLSESEFWFALRKFTAEWTRFRKRLNGRPTWFTRVPPLDACRAAWQSRPQPQKRRQTLRGAIASGHVRAMPIGQDWLITLRSSDLDRWQRRSE